MPKVYNKKNKNVPKEATYVGRPTRWGNPFIIGKDGTREEVIQKYRDYIRKAELEHAIKTVLKGKDLVCWCAPETCHADVLLEIANG
jgi:hypothetical protein